jgi:hypothetical protein
MTDEAPTSAEPAPWAAPGPAVPTAPSGGSKQSKLKLGIVAAVSGVIVIGGGVAVANAASSGGAVTQQGRGPGGYGGGNFPGGNRGGVMGVTGALHGDFVVKDSTGKYVTERLQSGTVTAVSATSITAKSEDGHSTTFVVGADTKVDNGSGQIADVKAGHTVTIIGIVSGDTATATAITDAALRPTTDQSGAPGNRPGGPGNGQGGGPGGGPGGGQRPRGSAQPTPSK